MPQTTETLGLMYHDVVDAGAWDSSGLPGAGAAHYKLDWPSFAQQMQALRGVLPGPPATVHEFLSGTAPEGIPFFLTFDDGGASAARTAEFLDRLGWRGHFFVVTDRIGTSAFLNAAQIREMAGRGHVIGSHSASHPGRIAALSEAEILKEWRTSLAALTDILGRPVRVASVPGGYYDQKVGRAAAVAGIEVLFTSEPTMASHRIEDCLVLGRYHVSRTMTTGTVAALVSGRGMARSSQALQWKLKRIAKGLAGDHYIQLREFLLQRR